jgi:hypothetical protein
MSRRAARPILRRAIETWFSMVCIDCDRVFSLSAGRGIGDAGGLLTRTLTGTTFYVSKGSFGGAYRSDGQELQRLLSTNCRAGGGVSYVVHTEGREK